MGRNVFPGARRDVAQQIGGLIREAAKEPDKGEPGTDPDGPEKGRQKAN